jgi:hypothetical protein
LLGELDGGACGEGDVVIGREQGDQANREACKGLDPALEIETEAASRRGLVFREVWRRFESGIGFGSGIGLLQGPAASIKQHSTPVRTGSGVLAAVRRVPTPHRQGKERATLKMEQSGRFARLLRQGSQLGSYEG